MNHACTPDVLDDPLLYVHHSEGIRKIVKGIAEKKLCTPLCSLLETLAVVSGAAPEGGDRTVTFSIFCFLSEVIKQLRGQRKLAAFSFWPS
jgi:hypothetical protein